MENPKVSILVPIYNVEKYLPRCIESVLSQDFRDYELILVDDGSPDRCPQICDEYAKKDSRIKVVHKRNGGLVSARLAGFMEARGEYVMHVDSDDYLLPNAISTLYNEAKEGDYDVVKSRPLREDENGKRWQENYMINEGKILDDESGLPHLAHALTNLCYLIELTTPEPEFKECGDIELTNNTQRLDSNSAIIKPLVDSKPNDGKNNFAFFSKFVSNRGRNKK